MSDEEIAQDAAAEIECLVFDADRDVGKWEKIILAAIKKARNRDAMIRNQIAAEPRL
jgi:hypothetical protein